MITDTHPEADAVQIELLRRKTSSERLEMALDLTGLTVYHARRAIARLHPGCSKREIDLFFIETHYGQELADQFRAWLERNES